MNPAELPKFYASEGLSQEGARKLNAAMAAIRPILSITGVINSGITVTHTPSGVSIGADIPAEAEPLALTSWVIVREIIDPEAHFVGVEFAVEHLDFAGSENVANRGRFVAESELGQSDSGPVITSQELTSMSVWPHWKAGDFEALRWAIGARTNKTTDILPAEFRFDNVGGGGWFVKPDIRMVIDKLSQTARVGSCFDPALVE